MRTPKITVEELRAIFSYDPDSGLLTWVRSTASIKQLNGREAGWVTPNGYRRVSVNKTKMYVHRVAWAMTHGAWPSAEIDHANGEPLDNRLTNLREASRPQNAANSRQRGVRPKGVRFHKKSGLWNAVLTKNYKVISLGYFYSMEAAHQAYVEGAKKHFGEFARAA